jgi:hypothetical protein
VFLFFFVHFLQSITRSLTHLLTMDIGTASPVPFSNTDSSNVIEEKLEALKPDAAWRAKHLMYHKVTEGDALYWQLQGNAAASPVSKSFLPFIYHDVKSTESAKKLQFVDYRYVSMLQRKEDDERKQKQQQASSSQKKGKSKSTTTTTTTSVIAPIQETSDDITRECDDVILIFKKGDSILSGGIPKDHIDQICSAFSTGAKFPAVTSHRTINTCNDDWLKTHFRQEYLPAIQTMVEHIKTCDKTGYLSPVPPPQKAKSDDTPLTPPSPPPKQQQREEEELVAVVEKPVLVIPSISNNNNKSPSNKRQSDIQIENNDNQPAKSKKAPASKKQKNTSQTLDIPISESVLEPKPVSTKTGTKTKTKPTPPPTPTPTNPSPTAVVVQQMDTDLYGILTPLWAMVHQMRTAYNEDPILMMKRQAERDNNKGKLLPLPKLSLVKMLMENDLLYLLTMMSRTSKEVDPLVIRDGLDVVTFTPENGVIIKRIYREDPLRVLRRDKIAVNAKGFEGLRERVAVSQDRFSDLGADMSIEAKKNFHQSIIMKHHQDLARLFDFVFPYKNTHHEINGQIIVDHT